MDQGPLKISLENNVVFFSARSHHHVGGWIYLAVWI